jgi:hypothetical protein
MMRHPIGRVLVAALLLAGVLLPAAAQAQAIIKVNDTVFFRIGFQLQAWADWQQDAATRGYAQNLYIRRARFLLSGQVAPDVTFFFQTDNPNYGKAPKAFNTGFIMQDAWMEWKINDAFMIDGGLFLVPLSRNALQSTQSFLTFDISPTSTVFITPTQTSNLRDTGFEAKGYLADGHLEYRAALFQGVRLTGSRNAFRDSAYLQYDVFDTEKGYVYAGTNLGKKKILALSAGYDTQNDYHAYSGDVFTTLPVGAGDEFGGQVQGIHYDGGKFLPAIPRQNDILVEASFYVAAAKLAPFGKFESQKFSNAIDKPKDQTRFGGGMHYYLSNQNYKISAQIVHVTPKSPIKGTNEFTIALQAVYY